METDNLIWKQLNIKYLESEILVDLADTKANESRITTFAPFLVAEARKGLTATFNYESLIHKYSEPDADTLLDEQRFMQFLRRSK